MKGKHIPLVMMTVSVLIFAIIYGLMTEAEILRILANANVAGDHWNVIGLCFIVTWFSYAFQVLLSYYDMKRAFLLALLFANAFYSTMDLFPFIFYYLLVPTSVDPSSAHAGSGYIPIWIALSNIFIWRWQAMMTVMAGWLGSWFLLKKHFGISKLFIIGILWQVAVNIPVHAYFGIANFHWIAEPLRTNLFWLLYVPDYLFWTFVAIGIWKKPAKEPKVTNREKTDGVTE